MASRTMSKAADIRHKIAMQARQCLELEKERHAEVDGDKRAELTERIDGCYAEIKRLHKRLGS